MTYPDKGRLDGSHHSNVTTLNQLKKLILDFLTELAIKSFTTILPHKLVSITDMLHVLSYSTHSDTHSILLFPEAAHSCAQLLLKFRYLVSPELFCSISVSMVAMRTSSPRYPPRMVSHFAFQSSSSAFLLPRLDGLFLSFLGNSCAGLSKSLLIQIVRSCQRTLTCPSSKDKILLATLSRKYRHG